MELHAARGLELQKTVYGDEQTRPDIARKRDRWRKYQSWIDFNRLEFIDDKT
jgi:hypothetical protein